METGLNAFKEALHLKHVEAGSIPRWRWRISAMRSMSWRSEPLS